MLPLTVELRKQLENAIPTARDLAEETAGVVLTTLAVDRPEPYPSMSPDQRRLRNGLRARARQLGNGVMTDGLVPLQEEIAYQQWHRMVFACFLAENNLLMHSSGVPVTLKDCNDLAADEGELDGWIVAAKYASAMLPGIFRPDDPAAQVRLAPEGQRALESILKSFPPVTFTADDSLGWMYQFWQRKKKEEVNRSERKIGGADLAPVTQLFTEDYMVRFLLENSLGAWWAGKHPESKLLKQWDYLRFKEDGTPAAGVFPGWPQSAAEVTIMDPCCGSGHFLVAAFEMLCQMRMEEEGLDETVTAEAVLCENIFGLEIDPRCTQIAAFALILSVWKCGGYRPLPVPNVACSGIPVQGQLETWLKLAGDDIRLRAALERLYTLFTNAPDLGSLINPADLPQNEMFTASYEEVAPVLEQALAKERVSDDSVAEVFGVAAEGAAKAARLLASNYALVITNVPYLGRSKQDGVLKEFCDLNHPLSKADLATVFLERCRSFTKAGGSYAIVVPQNWLFLSTYKPLRKNLLQEQSWTVVARLGAGAFETIGGEVVNVALDVFTNNRAVLGNTFFGLDVSKGNGISEKGKLLTNMPTNSIDQSVQLNNPDYKIVLSSLSFGRPLSLFVSVYEGMHSGDYLRFGRNFWEISKVDNGWVVQQASPDNTMAYGGRENVLFWEDGNGELIRFVQERLQSDTVTLWIKGHDAWGKKGVAVSTMSNLKATLYTGEIFTHGAVVIIPKNTDYLEPLWAYCQSSEFYTNVRKLDQKVSVARATFDGIPFDLEHWQKLAEATGPLPEPHSDDPTQWLFEGNPVDSSAPLHVAVARLLGYHWPEQTKDEPGKKKDELDILADEDGIVCLPSVAGESPLVERLRGLLAVAYGEEWSPQLQVELLASAGAASKNLEEWLRDNFFAQHCHLFHNRPFIWHIWDGRKDGFSALVNYHKLDSTLLDKLIYTYLGDWIRFQRARRDYGEPGSDGRLVAALELEKKLKAIKEGELPYDIYVRWKPLREQPLGWNPDLNDGVRLNIRPFVTAGVLRSKFTIHWNKDRGKNPDRSERLNDLHLTLAEKRSARGG